MTAHVLFIFEGASYPPDTRLRAQIATLLEAGYRVTVISPTGDYDKHEETVDGAYVKRYVPARGGRGAAGYLREYATALFHIARLARRVHNSDRVDLVFVCNPPDLMVVAALPLLRRGVKLLFEARELSPELFEAKFHRRGLLHELLLFSERYAVGRADTVIAASESFIDILRARCGVERDRIFLVGNGPDPKRVYPVDPEPALRQRREHLVLWLGVKSRQEGLERLIEAADEIVNGEGRRDVTFAVVGPGDAQDELRAAIRRRRLEDFVSLVGGVGDELVRAYLSTADVCVGVDECIGMNDHTQMRKILEYMAIGRPIVQFPLTEMRRICGETAVYARNADSHDLAEKIAALLDDPERRRRLGELARIRAHDGLLWPQQAPALLDAVVTALDQDRTGVQR
jgi:glycosyltransferase involved in cell wall biosynthesis